MTTLRQAAKAGYGLNIISVTGVAKACGTRFRDLYTLRKDGPITWKAPAWLASYGLMVWAQALEC